LLLDEGGIEAGVNLGHQRLSVFQVSGTARQDQRIGKRNLPLGRHCLPLPHRL
jgi:hypothetical protein